MTVIQLFGHDTSNVSEANFELVFGGLLEGVMGGLDNECRVVQSAVAAMTVEVMTGTFVTGGVFARVSAQEVLVIPVADGVNPRIDRVVCRRDNATDTVTVYILAGTPAGAPVPTALTRAGGVWEISLAQVYVGTGVGNITRANIADERRSRPVCGLISPNGSPDALFPLVNNPGQIGGASGQGVGGAGTLAGWGLLANLTDVGAGAATQAIDAGGLYVRRTSGAGIGNPAGWEAFEVTRRGVSPAVLMKWKLPTTITSQRVFCGLADTTLTTMTGSDAPGGRRYIAVQYSTPRGDTTWQFISDSGAGQVISDSQVAVGLTPVSARIIGDEATDRWQIDLIDQNGNVVAGRVFEAPDNIPVQVDDLRAMMGLETRVAAGREFDTYLAHIVNRVP